MYEGKRGPLANVVSKMESERLCVELTLFRDVLVMGYGGARWWFLGSVPAFGVIIPDRGDFVGGELQQTINHNP